MDSTAPVTSSFPRNALPLPSMARSPSPVRLPATSGAEAGLAALQGLQVAGADGQRQQVSLCCALRWRA